MAEVLTQKQIDEILGNLNKSDSNDTKSNGSAGQKNYKEYDFSTPKRITREQMKLLDSIFENFARLFALQLSSMLRVGCEAEVVSLDEYMYSEFSNALRDSVLMGIFNLLKDGKPSEKEFLLEMSRPLSYSIIDRLMGGNGEGYDIEKEYTEIELSLAENIFTKTTGIFSNSWNNYIDMDAGYNMIETNSRLVQSIAPDETVIVVVIDVVLKSLREKINVCVPLDTLTEIFTSFDTKFARIKKGDTEVEVKRRDYIMGSLTETPLTVSGILGETEIRLQDLLSLTPGDVIPLNTLTHGNSVKVNVDNVPWFTGVMGVKKKKYAIRVGTVMD